MNTQLCGIDFDFRAPHLGSRLRRLKFAEYYLAFQMNGARAAIAAGYKASNARFYAARLLKDPRVREIVAVRAKIAVDRVNAQAG